LGANLLILCIFSFYHFTAEPQHIIALELWSQLFRRKFVKSVKNIDHDDIGLIFKKISRLSNFLAKIAPYLNKDTILMPFSKVGTAHFW
jgi:hypothetical protein